MTQLSEEQRARLDTQLTAALEAHQRIAHQSRRLTQGKSLPYCKIVNAYDPTIAPICKGKSNGPAQFGRKPGMIAEPAAGFIFALHLPVGNPSDTSYVQPLVDKVPQAIAQMATSPRPAIHALAGDLAFNDTSLREALHQQGILTVGIPKTVALVPPAPTPEDVLRLLCEESGPRARTPCQVHLAYASGIQPTRGRKPHGQPAVPWSDADHRQRSSRRDRTHGDGRHGAPRGDVGPHPRVSSVEAGAPVPPTAAFEMPSSQSSVTKIRGTL
jgi:hypothetical protein